jgi:chromosome segregation ATPase
MPQALQDQLVTAQATIAAQRQQLREAEEREVELEALRLSRETQTAELEKMRGEHLESSLVIASLRNDLQEAQSKGESSEHSVRALQQALTSLKVEAESADGRAASELKSMHSSLNQMRSRAVAAEEALEAETRKAEARVATLQENISILEQTVGEGRRMLHHKLGDAERENGQLREQNTRLRYLCSVPTLFICAAFHCKPSRLSHV